MMTFESKPFVLRWGILATGGIAETFTKDLLTDPSSRSVSDVQHVVVAAASSSSASRATEFLKKVEAPSEAKAYGSYAELVADRDVDIIYVATPHSHHFQNTMLALEAGKNVLCEKAFTVNAAQTKKLVATAKAKGLFLMEAVWTRFFPMSIKIREMVKSGEIGNVHRVIADLSFNATKEDGSISFPDENRMVNLDLAGGALLDLGIYALTWVFQILYHTQPEPRERPQLSSSVIPYDRTGADAMTSMILSWPGQKTVGVALTGLIGGHNAGHEESRPCVRIYGTQGEIQIMGRAYRPSSYRILRDSEPGKYEEVKAEYPTSDGWGHGMYWEADEAARCLRDGKKESQGIGWEESVVIMEVMDSVRKEAKLVYPEVIESDAYDENSPLNSGRA